jgi:hypothetical protein
MRARLPCAPRAAGSGGSGFPGSNLLTGGLQWLNWDVARAYGASKAPLTRGPLDSAPSTPSSSRSGSPDASRDSGTSDDGSVSSSDGAGPSSSVSSGSSSSGLLTEVAAFKDPAKRERIRSAFTNGSLAFGFSAGGLMVRGEGECGHMGAG